MNLEIILENFTKTKVFKKNGNFTKEGEKAYIKLINVLYDVSELTRKGNIYEIIRDLDLIANEFTDKEEFPYEN